VIKAENERKLLTGTKKGQLFYLLHDY